MYNAKDLGNLQYLRNIIYSDMIRFGLLLPNCDQLLRYSSAVIFLMPKSKILMFVFLMKEAVGCSSSFVPHSLSSIVSPPGLSVAHVLLLSCSVSGQLISTCSGVCGQCQQSQRGVQSIFSLCMCALRWQWPVLNWKIVFL